MAAQYSNIVGIIGSQFKLGIGDEAPSIIATPDGQLYFNAPIQIKGKVEGQPYVPTEADDLATLDVVQRLASNAYSDACQFARNLLLSSGGGTGEDGSGDPPTIIIQNSMPDPVTFETMEDGYSLSLGVIEREKYLHQIVLELEQVFTTTDESRYEVAIGNESNPATYVDWFEVTGAQKSFKFDVLQTIHDLTEVKLFVRDWVDPNPWIQRVLNPHPNATISIQSYDAMKRIYEVTIHADIVPPGEDVVHTDIFGEDVLGKGYLDFGIPIKLKKDGHYRIAQIDNPALEQFNGTDPDVDENDGVWSKVSEIGPFPSNFDEDEGAQYFFLLGQARSDNDYTHIYVYDLDGADPNTAIWVFHIKNEIMVVTEDKPNMPGEASFEFHSASEGTMTAEKQEDGSYIINLSGEVLDKKSEMDDGIMPGLTSIEGKFTWITVTFTGYTGNSFRFLCQNPAYEYFYEIDGNITYNDGMYYLDVVLDVPENGSFSVEVLVSDKPGDINIVVIGDPSTVQADIVTIVNNLSIVSGEYELPGSGDGDDDDGAVIINPDMTGGEDAWLTSDEPTAFAMERAATVTKTGRAKVRMLVF